MRPDTRKQVDPNASGRQTNRSYDGSDSAVCSARKVVALKKSVPANWIAGAPPAGGGPAPPPRGGRPAPPSGRGGPPPAATPPRPAVNSSEPTKKVTASAR